MTTRAVTQARAHDLTMDNERYWDIRHNGHHAWWQRSLVPGDFRPDRLVEVMDIQAGRYAVARFTGSAHEIVDAWDRVFSLWLPTSGYEPDDRPCYERYRGNATVDANAGTFRCELCLPVRRL